LGQFSKNYRTFSQKFVTKLKKYEVGIRDPASGKNLFRIPDPGSGSRSKRHRIPDPYPQHWKKLVKDEQKRIPHKKEKIM
jgi:hypothetical protein